MFRILLTPIWRLGQYYVAVRKFNISGEGNIKSIVCLGLATGIGCMPARKCAAQMRVAYNYLNKPERIPSFQEIHQVHKKLHCAV